MGYTRQQLKQELLRCYNENGRVTSSILNDPENDYPTQVSYSNHFGSLTEAKESVNILGGHTKERVLSDIEKCYSENGNVSIQLINESNKFINSNTLYKHFDSLWTAIAEAEISEDELKKSKKTEQRKYDADELLELLIECKEDMGDTKTKTINKYSRTPSSQPYQSRFGSLEEARQKAGIYSKPNNLDEAKRIIKSLDSYDDGADAHIYVLDIVINDNEGYYVGETTNLHNRLHSHLCSQNIQVWADGQHGRILAPRSETNKLNSVSINSVKYVIPMNKKGGESDIDFRRRRKYREHHEHLSIAIENDTLEVYGGR